MTVQNPVRRRARLTSLGVIAALTLASCSPPGDDGPADSHPTEVPEKPSSPVALNIMDGGSRIAVETAIDRFVTEHPDIVSEVNWESISEDDIASALTPQVNSGNLEVDLVFTGSNGVSTGIDNDLWVPVVDAYADHLPNMANYTEPAEELQALTEGYGATVVWCYCGPTIQYNPDVVDSPPQTLEDLLAWVEANPGDFGYPRPANSGIGRTFLFALPYMLGDEDPEDPADGWNKTWEYLEELGTHIDNYPTSTGLAMDNLADGTWTLMPSSVGWDVGPRARGQVPADVEGYALDETTWVMDPNYAVIPRGLSEDRLSAVLSLVNYILSPEGNASAGDGPQYIPGIVVDNVEDDMIPSETTRLLDEFSRDWFAEAFETSEAIPPPSQAVVVEALDIWDRRIASGG